MQGDSQYSNLNFKLPEIEHKYGENVHILANPYLQTLLAKLGRPETEQPLLNNYVQTLYRHLFSAAVNICFPTENVSWETRMKEFNPEGVFEGDVVSPKSKAVVVNLARAGTYPSHLCYDELNYLIEPKNIRQDHFYLNRKVDDEGKVVGVDVSGSKIGGGQDGAVVFYPDPMGATGGSLSHCVTHYKENVPGKAHKYVALHIIVTPEYIQRMSKDHPDVKIISIRLDRGLSDTETLKTIPGTNPEKEKGLNDNQYIVPGAGGVGEILNNSYV